MDTSSMDLEVASVSSVESMKLGMKCAMCGATKRQYPERKFFRFPMDASRCRLWVEACGNKRLLDKPSNILYRKYRICSSHFTDKFYAGSKRHFLTSYAVPLKLGSPGLCSMEQPSISSMSSAIAKKLREDEQCGVEPNIARNFFELEVSGISSCTQAEVSNTSELSAEIPCCSTPRRDRSFQRTITPKTKKIKKLSTKLYYLQRKYSRATKVFSKKNNLKLALNIIKPLLKPVLYNFIESQLKAVCVTKYGRRWTVNDKNLCLQLYLASPKAYNTLREFLHLPNKSTLLKTVQCIQAEPGFSAAVLNAIHFVASKLKPYDKHCILSFDEMSLRPGLHYNKRKDVIDGFENYGSYSNSSTNMATHVLVFMVRGLCKKWKQVIGFFFTSHTAPAATLEILVSAALTKLFQCGLKPVAIVCDQGANNQKLYVKQLCVTANKPYFLLNGHKVFTLFDVPHLLKCTRNNFRKYPVKFGDSKTAFFDHIVSLWEFDCKLPHRMVPKLTEKHVKVDGLSAMSVRLAAQVLSQSVASSLCCLSTLGYLPASATHTADFCSAINDLFDSLNSRVLRDRTRPLLSAVTKDSSHVQLWQKKLEFVQSLEFQTQGKKITFPCLLGWQITLSAFLELIPTLLTDIPFIMMSRFTQDALENLFSVVRRRGGSNDHPTAYDFQHRIKMIMAQNIINTCGKANCEPDNDTVLISKQVLTVTTNSESSPFEDLEESEVDAPPHAEGNDTSDPAKANAAAYVAGYVAKRTCAMFNCNACHQLLLGDKTLTENSMFLYFKEFNDVKEGLTYPSEALTRTICIMGEKFISLFSTICYEQHVKTKLISQLKDTEHENLSCGLHELEVWDYIVSSYVQLMLYYKTKEISKGVKNRKRANKKISKLN